MPPAGRRGSDVLPADAIRGIIPALITPMTGSGELDEKGLARLVDVVVAAGVHGVFVGGTAGEAWALSPEEKGRLFAAAAAAARGRVPVFAGTGANSTGEALRLSQAAREAGADVLSVVAPSFVAPSQDELFDHFRAIARSVDLPVLLYDIPGRSGNELSVDLVLRLAAECGNIVGLKDSTGNFAKAMEFLRRQPAGFRYIMGNDNLILPALQQGAAGAIAATASVAPKAVVAIHERFAAGDMAGALERQRRLAPLRQAFSLGTHPAMLKAGCEILYGLGGPPRLPVRPLDARGREALRRILDDVNREGPGT